MEKRRLKVVELFGGIGAIRKAMLNNQMNFEVIDYVEINKNAVKSYNALYNENYKSKSVKGYKLPDKKIDLLFHGSPCQDFSIAGTLKGGEKNSNTRSSLLWETVRIIDEAKIKPKVIIWENVSSVLSKRFEFTFYNYIDELEKLGYVSRFKILNAKDFGIPQNRKRLFAVSVFHENNFDFSKLKKAKMKKLSSFLEENVPVQYLFSDEEICRAKKINFFRPVKDYVFTILTKAKRFETGFIRTQNNSYRTITEKEALVLMGFSYEDYETLKKVHPVKNDGAISSILFKQAGNSIVVNVLMSILLECERSCFL